LTGKLRLAPFLVPISILAGAAPTPAQPTKPFQANNGDFSLLMLMADDKERFLREWLQPTPPNLTTTNWAVRNKPLYINLILAGCAPDAEGNCNVSGSYSITDPLGKNYGKHDDVPVFKQRATGPKLMALSPVALALRVEDGEALGPYKIVVKVTDRNSGKSLVVEDVVEVVEAPTSK
jgi:hypothetical protein